MSPKKLTITERVLAKVRDTPPRHKTWFDRLEDEHKQECAEIKRSWLAGEIKSSAIRLADHISASLREAGASTVGIQGVVQWLRKRD